MADPGPAAAVGRLAPGGDWIGIRRARAGWELVMGADRGVVAVPPGRGPRADILAAALVFFDEALDPAPVEAEATQADLADAVRWLADAEPSGALGSLLRAATDAIDDGLAGDEVMARLAAAAPADVRADPVAYLRRRAATVTTGG